MIAVTNKVGQISFLLLCSSFLCEVSSFPWYETSLIPSVTFIFHSTTCDELYEWRRIMAARHIMTDKYIMMMF